MDYGPTNSSLLVFDWSYFHPSSFTLDFVIFETLERDARYSSKTINCASKAPTPAASAIGLNQTPHC